MTPDTLAKSNSEHAHQRALFAWANMAAIFGFAAAWDDRCYTEQGYASKQYGVRRVDALARMHAIKNVEKGGAVRGAMAKAEGVKKGVPDIFLPLPRNVWAGLYIEMKRPKAQGQAAGSTSGDQDDWIGYLRSVGYGVAVAFNWREAAKQVQSYIEWSANAEPKGT